MGYEDILGCLVIALALIAGVRNLWYARHSNSSTEMRAYVAAKGVLTFGIALLYAGALAHLVDPAGQFNPGRVSLALVLLSMAADAFIRRTNTRGTP